MGWAWHPQGVPLHFYLSNDVGQSTSSISYEGNTFLLSIVRSSYCSVITLVAHPVGSTGRIGQSACLGCLTCASFPSAAGSLPPDVSRAAGSQCARPRSISGHDQDLRSTGGLRDLPCSSIELRHLRAETRLSPPGKRTFFRNVGAAKKSKTKSLTLP